MENSHMRQTQANQSIAFAALTASGKAAAIAAYDALTVARLDSDHTGASLDSYFDNACYPWGEGEEPFDQSHADKLEAAHDAAQDAYWDAVAVWGAAANVDVATRP